MSGTRLKAKYVASPDGSRIYRRGVLYDTQLATDCAYRAAADGSLRCLPKYDQATNGEVMFADASCSTGVVWFPSVPLGCTFSHPKYVLDFDTAPTCTPAQSDVELHARVYEVGGVFGASGSFYRKDATTGTCKPMGYTPTGVALSLGPEVAPDTFVAGIRSVKP